MAWPKTWADGDDLTPASADSQSISSLSVGFMTLGGASVLTTTNALEQSLSTLTVTGKSYFSNAEDVDTTGVTGAVIIGGDGTGAHVAIDGNELMQKSSSTSVGALDIPGAGGALWLGATAATDSDATIYILSDLSAVQSPSHFGRTVFLGTQTSSTVTVAGVSNGLEVIGQLLAGSGQFSADSNGVTSLVTHQVDGILYCTSNVSINGTYQCNGTMNCQGVVTTNVGLSIMSAQPVASGTAGLYFKDDTDTGIGSSAANRIDFVTGGVSRVQITGTGGAGDLNLGTGIALKIDDGQVISFGGTNYLWGSGSALTLGGSGMVLEGAGLWDMSAATFVPRNLTGLSVASTSLFSGELIVNYSQNSCEITFFSGTTTYRFYNDFGEIA